MSYRIQQGDCLELLKGVDGVQLCYIDPPFHSGKDYRARTGEVAFSDRWDSFESYLRFLLPRVELAWSRTSGSLVLHLDPKVAHHVECALEPELGACASRIIWRYRRWPSKQKNFQRVHDVLLRWSRPDAPWNQLYERQAPSTLKKYGSGKQVARVENGSRVYAPATSKPSPGVPMGDVWDIGIIAPQARERTGYPTQKPRALLDRLVLSCSESGGLVVDPTMGSGSMVEAAVSHGRRGVGFDSSPVALRTAAWRLTREAA